MFTYETQNDVLCHGPFHLIQAVCFHARIDFFLVPLKGNFFFPTIYYISKTHPMKILPVLILICAFQAFQLFYICLKFNENPIIFL